MVSVLHFGLSGQGTCPGWGTDCVVFLGKACV